MGRKEKGILLEDNAKLSIGQKMRQARQAKKISLSQMGEILNRSKSYLSGVENNSVQPSSTLIRGYEQILEVKFGEVDKAIEFLQQGNQILDQPQLRHLQDITSWNRWRSENKNVSTFLSRTNLSGIDLSGIDLSGIDLSASTLSETSLNGANLSGAKLNGANLSGAKLNGANLSWATFYGADLNGTDLSQANLSWANFSGADLSQANLTLAYLMGTNLNSTILVNTNLNNAVMCNTILADLDMHLITGLETVKHEGPSTVGINSLFLSKGEISENFLRGTGIPDTIIEYQKALVNPPIVYYSCFISYSNKDEEFVKRLYNDLQAQGIRCWFAPEDLKIGDQIKTRIDESIRLFDKLILVLSENSQESKWVEHELQVSMEKENQKGSIVLFPIRLDDSVMQSNLTWATMLRRSRHIGDFHNWKRYDDYQIALTRLLRDLKKPEHFIHKF